MPRTPFLLVLVAAGAGAVGCTSARHSSAPTTAATSPAPSTTSTTVRRPTTTVKPWAPTAGQGTPEAAAGLLVDAWSTGRRAEASSVAAPAAVAAMFAVPYPAGELQFRGCTEGANPDTCTYRNLATDAIYEIGATAGTTGWYISSFTPET